MNRVNYNIKNTFKPKKKTIITRNPDFFKELVGTVTPESFISSNTNIQDYVLEGDFYFDLSADLSLLNQLSDEVAFDTETTGLSRRHDRVFSIQLADKNQCFLIDLQIYPELPGETLNITLEEVVPYFINKKIVIHNALFDLGFLFYNNFFVQEVEDTMIYSKLLYNGYDINFHTSFRYKNESYKIAYYRNGFGSVMFRELNLFVDKTSQKKINSIQINSKETIAYCFIDVEFLLELKEVLRDKIDKRGFAVTADLHNRFVKALTYMELCGMPISKKLWREKMQEDKNNLEQCSQNVKDYIYDNIPKYRQNNLFSSLNENKEIDVLLSSTKQMIPVFKHLGFDISVEDSKTKKTKDSIELGNLSKYKDHDFIKLWESYSKAFKRVSTFGENVLSSIETDKDGHDRLYGQFNIIVDTGRISCVSDSKINFLNFPSDSETRKCFVANPGFKIVACDYNAQEVRTTADITQDKALIESINKDLDLHCMFARVMYPELADLSDDEIKKNHKAERQSAKAPRFTINYGGGVTTLMRDLNISRKEASNIFNSFVKLHEDMFNWADKMLDENIQRGSIKNSTGFELQLPNFREFSTNKNKLKDFIQDNKAKNPSFVSDYYIGKSLSFFMDKIENYNATVASIQDEEKRQKFIKEELLEIEEICNSYQNINKLVLKGQLSIEYSANYEVLEVKTSDVSNYLKVYNKNKTEFENLKSNLSNMTSIYKRLTMNNPSQSLSAHQTKLALSMLFERILKDGDVWKARISNSPYDEIVMEVTEELADKYKTILRDCMVEGGNYFLTSNLVVMDAEAKIADSWEEAK